MLHLMKTGMSKKSHAARDVFQIMFTVYKSRYSMLARTKLRKKNNKEFTYICKKCKVLL